MNNLSNKFNQFIIHSGVSTSMFFMLLKITGVNMYTIHYVLHSLHSTPWMWLIGFFGSIPFALITVSVLQKKGNENLKKILPCFDAIFILIGFNLELPNQINDGSVNWMAVSASIVIAIFTGVTTYSLGKLTAVESSKTVPQENYNKIESQLKSLQEKYEQLKTESKNYLIIINELEQIGEESILLREKNKDLTQENEKSKSQFHLQLQELKQLEETAKGFEKKFKNHNLYKAAFIKSEVGRLRKKKKNRTPEEEEFLTQNS